MRKSLPGNLLEGRMEFAVFGLGDSSYPKFNYAAKKLYKRLLSLGATPLPLARGDGDHQHYLGLDGALSPWLESFQAILLKKYPLPDGMELNLQDLPEPTFRFDFLKNADTLQETAEVLENTATRAASSLSTCVKVLRNERITPETHFQDVRLVEFSSSTTLNYAPGDVMMLKPENLPDPVDDAVRFFGWQDFADTPFEITSRQPGSFPIPFIHWFLDIPVPHHLRKVWTIRRLLKQRLDLFGRPRRYLFELLQHFASVPEHMEKLSEFASSSGQVFQIAIG